MDELPSNPEKNFPPTRFGSDFNPYSKQGPPAPTQQVCSSSNPICHIPLNVTHQHTTLKPLTSGAVGQSFSPPAETKPEMPKDDAPKEQAIPIKITHTDKYSVKEDPPMVDLKVTNPVSYFKKWLARFLKNQDIDIHLKIKPFATIGLFLAFAAVGSTTFSIGRYLFPNSSPILHRQVIYSGVVKQDSRGESLLMQADSTVWKLKLKSNNVNFSNIEGKQVVVTGNLTAEPKLIEVSEVIVGESITQPDTLSDVVSEPLPIPRESVLPITPEKDSVLPKLFDEITWEKTEKKVLTFTSGKRRIEQEGVYLESALQKDYPQDFISYYFIELTNGSFKETLNSADPNGVIITYASGETFVTFGVKNIYTGSGDNKKLSGYKAYLEHN